MQEEARARNPKRWSNGIRNFETIGDLVLNPDKDHETEEKYVA